MAIEEKTIQALADHFFANEELNLYAVFDGASVTDLRTKIFEHQPEHECLYPGELEPDLAEVAPYLIKLTPDSEFTLWILEEGWGNHWGIFAQSPADLRSMRRHFRTLLKVHDPDGKPMLFRYYDPRVLRIYLPTCNSDELKIVFGPVENYLLEDENAKSALRYRLVAGALKQEKLELTDAS
jgi:hypothetical protein